MHKLFATSPEWQSAKAPERASAMALALTLFVCLSFIAPLFIAAPVLAEHTRWWRQNSFEDLDKGNTTAVAVRSDGKLFLAPRFTSFADANLAYLLALAVDSKGNVYAGGGSNAKVLKFDSTGKATTVFQSSELAVQTLAFDASGNLYVGTSPDGKVYKVTPAGQSSVFFDPKTKYIWGLAINREGILYVATGDTGKIFEVSPDGKSQVFYSGDETHIRALAFDGNGDILAGTEPRGLVLRIPKAAGQNPAAPRHAFVLYETERKEITALLHDGTGKLYVAAVGEKLLPSSNPPRGPNVDSGASPTGNFTITVGPQGGQPPIQQANQGQTPALPLPVVTSSSVYRIAADGSPEELWTSRDDIVYSLGLQSNGKLLLGTGNRGAILELEGNHVFSRLIKTASRQITAILPGPGGKQFVASGNPGKLYVLASETEPEGTYESQPFDAKIFSRWGQLEWWAQGTDPSKKGNTRIEFYARSGNTSDPSNNWSPWAGPYSNSSGAKIDCPAARFVQWKAVLHGAGNGAPPELDWVGVAYLPKNVAPDVTAIAIQNPGIRAQGLSIPITSGQTSVPLRMPQPASTNSPFGPGFGAEVATAPGRPARFEGAPQGSLEKGFETVLWTAGDDNDDDLQFAIYYRGENENTWKLLKDKLDTHYYSWDTTGMPDGAYYLKIVASDAPSNPPADALQTERESDRFEVDNTPPSISQLASQLESRGKGVDGFVIRVRFQANDPSSAIARSQYSVDSGNWTLVFPLGGLSDSPQESYDFQLQNVAAGEHTVTVRVYDEFENVTSAKTTVVVPSSGK